jgi:hypothetical protein
MVMPQFIEKIILAFQSSELLRKSGEAGVIIMTGLIASHFVSRIVGLVIRKFNWVEKIRKYGIKNPDTFVEAASHYIILAIAFIFALNRLGILTTIVSIVGLTFATIVVILLALNFKDIILNFFYGAVFRGLNRKIKKNTFIKAGDIYGEVKRLGLVEVELLNKKKETVMIPYSHLVKSKIEVLRE